MPYRLCVTAGPSLDLATHTPVQVNNDPCPVEIQSQCFRGRITVRVKGCPGIAGDVEGVGSSSYFTNKTATFSLQCQGQYGDLARHDVLTTDDILFGIVLRNPLSDTPPLGLALIERTMRFFWPLMENNLQAPAPWVLSPMFATMSRIGVQVATDPAERKPSLISPAQKYFREAMATTPRLWLPPWPGIIPDAESENLQEFLSRRAPPRKLGSHAPTASLPSDAPRPFFLSYFSPSPWRDLGLDHPRSPKERKKYFSSQVLRKNVRIDPTDIITTDFRNSFIDFRTLSLNVPGVPLKIDLAQHMVGRPTQYVCRSRSGEVYWAIVFTILKDS